MFVCVQICVSPCVLVIFNTSFKNVKLLKFQLSKADGLKWCSHGGSTECAQTSLFNINKMRLFLYRWTDKSILPTQLEKNVYIQFVIIYVLSCPSKPVSFAENKSKNVYTALFHLN